MERYFGDRFSIRGFRKVKSLTLIVGGLTLGTLGVNSACNNYNNIGIYLDQAGIPKLQSYSEAFDRINDEQRNPGRYAKNLLDLGLACSGGFLAAKGLNIAGTLK
ncbi:hypothetical protein A3B39_03295 [Candidatus Daviesbacteria bacterium RIFCSPLOWO2_01_FULL_37_10]|nr:MAG: hypothetical protein A3B39_03295 [Candidatus Daviesbacteria bacterium RIFCSPLOWO2_01_FULL_37_10]